MGMTPTTTPMMASVLCATCRHSLLHSHYRGVCECGCERLETHLTDDVLALQQYEMRRLYHERRGTPLATKAKKAYYTLIDLREDRTAHPVAQTATW